MRLSDEHIARFQALYLKRFGKEISKEEARDKGIKLFRLMTLIYRPMTKGEFEAVQVRRKELSK
ncbi:MAG: hypothetical protein WAZ27_04540 [Minisyncoccia bacterium]